AAIIDGYRNELADRIKSPRDLLDFAFGRSIYRAFHHETPLRRFHNWRWYRDADSLPAKLGALKDQASFDACARELGKSLVADWGAKNDQGGDTKMNEGIAMKITNLVLKPFAFSALVSNSPLRDWLHVPWDSYTLTPLRGTWTGKPRLPRS